MSKVILTPIGNLTTEDGGHDEYLKIEADDDIDPQMIGGYVEHKLYRSNWPGQIFCTSWTFMVSPYRKTEGVVVLHHQMDI